MPKIIVVESSLGPDKEINCEQGGSVLDEADDARLPIPFSCRSASCATCHCEVLEGAELLEPAGEDELDLLDIIGASKTSRLACQMITKAGPGTLKLKPV